ncbi:MAG: class I tRNA ligase family protein, partial [Desulfobulbaceae bacterium]|nr:class I tRNA ligase family protein [Desulfobulbaceae bacterium]
RECLETSLLLLFPMVPHFCEELWETAGMESTIDYTNWPEYDHEAAKEDEITIIVQINGKVRSRLEVPADIDESVLQQQALEDERVIKFIDGKEPKKIIVVQKKLVNIVI